MHLLPSLHLVYLTSILMSLLSPFLLVLAFLSFLSALAAFSLRHMEYMLLPHFPASLIPFCHFCSNIHYCSSQPVPQACFSVIPIHTFLLPSYQTPSLYIFIFSSHTSLLPSSPTPSFSMQAHFLVKSVAWA